MEQKNCHKVTSLGELNATEIQQNILELFDAFTSVSFGNNSFIAQGCFYIFYFYKGQSHRTEKSWYLKKILKFTQQPGGQSDMV